MDSLIQTLKTHDQDFEFYPTTNEILVKIAETLKGYLRAYGDDKRSYKNGGFTILDVCAGDGNALLTLKQQLEKADFICLQGIEKSPMLYSMWDNSINLVGTDFFQENLHSKTANVLFCNPPFSQTETWFKRLLTEHSSRVQHIFFVCPSKQGLSDKYRDMFNDFKFAKDSKNHYDISMTVLQNENGETFSFENADRSARVDTVILHIDLHKYAEYRDFERSDRDALFAQYFPELQNKLEHSEDYSYKRKAREEKSKELESFMLSQAGEQDLVKILVDSFCAERNEFLDAYNKLNDVPTLLLDKLDIDLSKAKNLLFKTLQELDTQYWSKLFKLYEPLKQKLTSSSVNRLMKYVSERNIAFNYDNCLAVTLLAVQKTNEMIVQQLLDKYKHWAEVGNYKAYKSNQRLFNEGRFKDCIAPEDLTNNWSYGSDKKRWHEVSIDNIMPFSIGERKKLEYRIVDCHLSFSGGYSWAGFDPNSSAMQAVHDIIIIARNLGYTVSDFEQTCDYGDRVSVYATDRNGKNIVLFDFKVFKNGNAHFFLNKGLMIDIMLVVGKYLGWVHTKEQVMDDLDITGEEYDNAVKDLYLATSATMLGLPMPNKLS